MGKLFVSFSVILKPGDTRLIYKVQKTCFMTKIKNEYDEAMKLLKPGEVANKSLPALLRIIIIPIITIGKQPVSFMQINVPINFQYLSFVS